MRITLSIVATLLMLQHLIGQTDSTGAQGEIISGEVVIEKDNKIIMPQADKIFLRSAPQTFGNQAINIDFEIKEPIFEWPDYKSDVPFQTLNEQYPREGYQNYVKAGFGNYTSPLFEAGLYKTFGLFETRAKIFHESFNGGPVNDDNSSNATSSVDLAGTYKKENFKITPFISFRNNQYSFYGNANRINDGFGTEEAEDVSLNEFEFSVELSGEKDDILYSLKPSIVHVNQDLKTASGINKETAIGAIGTLGYKIDDAFNTGFDIEARSASYDGGLQIDRSLINVNPWVSHTREKLTIQAGFMLYSGKVGDESETGFYPRARVDYDITNKWALYGLLSGGQTWNGLSDLIAENQFLDDSLLIVQSEYKFQFGGGLKGSPVKNVMLDVSATYSSVEGLPFYVPSSADSSRYIVTYDTEAVGVFALKSRLSFMPTASSTYGVSLDVYGYSLESLDRPWHKPSYVFKAYTSHNIQEKLIVSAYLTSIGGIRGPANVDFGYVRLPAFTDVGLSAKYLITPRASAFIDVNNLLNNEYERYLGYPTRGITFKLGGQYRF